jgi:flavodoxin
MEIGIVVYSQTEHTYSVAQKLQEKLSQAGNSVNVERVTIAGDANPGSKNITFETQPNVDAYDGLVFGAPVHAFSLAPPMKAYMEQIPSLENKKIACFVTKGLPFNRTGGNQAISKMKKICESKGGTVIGTEILVWRGGHEKKMAGMVEKLSVLF